MRGRPHVGQTNWNLKSGREQKKTEQNKTLLYKANKNKWKSKEQVSVSFEIESEWIENDF